MAVAFEAARTGLRGGGREVLPTFQGPAWPLPLQQVSLYGGVSQFSAIAGRDSEVPEAPALNC